MTSFVAQMKFNGWNLPRKHESCAKILLRDIQIMLDFAGL